MELVAHTPKDQSIARQEAICAVLEGRQLPSQAAKTLGVSAKTLLRWLREDAQPGEQRRSRLQQQALTLETRLIELKQQLDRLVLQSPKISR